MQGGTGEAIPGTEGGRGGREVALLRINLGHTYRGKGGSFYGGECLRVSWEGREIMLPGKGG